MLFVPRTNWPDTACDVLESHRALLCNDRLAGAYFQVSARGERKERLLTADPDGSGVGECGELEIIFEASAGCNEDQIDPRIDRAVEDALKMRGALPSRPGFAARLRLDAGAWEADVRFHSSAGEDREPSTWAERYRCSRIPPQIALARFGLSGDSEGANTRNR